METSWSEWIWDASRREHYRKRLNEQGGVEYLRQSELPSEPSTFQLSYTAPPTYGNYQSHDVTPSGLETSSQRIIAQDHIKTEALDLSFKRVKAQSYREFFKVGRVFALLWTEPSSRDIEDDMAGAFTEVNYGQAAYTEIRRFIVIAPSDWHSLCVPIASYRRSGAIKRPDMAHHSIVFAGGTPPEPLPGENFEKYPIKLSLRSGESLETTSRINFSKIYTVENNVKVKLVGKVDNSYLPYVLQYSRDSSGIGPSKERLIDPPDTKFEQSHAGSASLSPTNTAPSTLQSVAEWNSKVSLIPDDIDRGSTASTDTWGSNTTINSAGNTALIEEFAAMILEDKTIQWGLSLGLHKRRITSNALEKNFTRLLKMLGQSLQREVRSKNDSAAAAFVRSRAKLTSQLIYIKVLSRDNRFGTERLLDQFLQGSFASGKIMLDEESMDAPIVGQEGGEDIGDEQLLEGPDDLSELSGVQNFILGSTAWRQFQDKFILWVCPSWAARVDRTISEWAKLGHLPEQLEQIFMVADDIADADPSTIGIQSSHIDSPINTFKGHIERLSRREWDWWPLSPYERPLNATERRLVWTCACGERQTAILPFDLALLIQGVATEVLIENIRASKEGIDIHIIPLHEKSPGTTSASFTIPATTTVAATVATISQTNPNSAVSPGKNQSNKAASMLSSSTTGGDSTSTTRLHLFFVLSCSQAPKLEQKMVDLHILDSGEEYLKDDQQLYKWIRQKYTKYRGWFQFHFGINQFAGCDFHQFNHYAPKCVSSHPRIVEKFPEPLVKDYIFKEIKQFPPISRHEFKQQVLRAGNVSLLSIVALTLRVLWQRARSMTLSSNGVRFDNKEDLLPTGKSKFSKAWCRNTKSALDRLPKRKTNIDEESYDLDIFIGIYSREQPSAFRFICWLLLLCIPSTVFAFVWLFGLGYSKDLQDAFILTSVTLPFLGILFSVFFIPEAV